MAKNVITNQIALKASRTPKCKAEWAMGYIMGVDDCMLILCVYNENN